MKVTYTGVVNVLASYRYRRTNKCETKVILEELYGKCNIIGSQNNRLKHYIESERNTIMSTHRKSNNNDINTN